jgi:hypothetical protein
MSDYPVARGARPDDPHLRLRLAALTAVIIGVILVALAAFLLSYTGIHQIALQAGVSPGLARLYPLMFDAMLIITCSAVLATRTAGWGTKSYVWVCLLLVVASVAIGDALYATGVHLTGQAARATVAVVPWVLLLLGFGIWLVMLRHWRRVRARAANGAEADRAAAAGPNGRAGRGAPAAQAGPRERAAQAGPGDRGARAAPAAPAGPAAGGAVSWAAGRVGADTRLEQQAGRAPERPRAAEGPAAANRAAATAQGKQRTASPGERQPAGTTPAAAGATAGAAAAAGIAAGTRPGTPPDSRPGTTRQTKPGTAAGTAATTPGTAAGTTPGTAATTPGTAGTTPGAADTAPGTAAASPGTAGTTPGTAGTTPGTSDTGAGADARAGAGATRAADPAGTGRDRGGQDQAPAQERRRRLGGLLEIPAGADDGAGSVRILPAEPKAAAGDAASSADDQASTPATATEPDPANPPAPLPHFDRPRSTPTPPQETGADGE